QELHNLAAVLMKYETLEGEEIDAAIKGLPIERKPAGASAPETAEAEEAPEGSPEPGAEGETGTIH
ncbi:MAG: hypothetical protein D6771_06420, partial [Zetaproteobacteria bacterium]